MSDPFIRNMQRFHNSSSFGSVIDALEDSTRTVIAHIDSGIAPHPALGLEDINRPPLNLLISDGLNTFDAGRDNRPIATLVKSRLSTDWLEHPAHGISTLSVILGQDDEKLLGLVPNAKVIPYRASNGPLFSNNSGPFIPSKEATAPLGSAIAHAVSNPNVRVISISMGNPPSLGPIEHFAKLLGVPLGLLPDWDDGVDATTVAAINKAYEAGVIVVCAAGQIVDSVIYPAAFPRTIGVGGFDSDTSRFFSQRFKTYKHYPYDGYSQPEKVDVWAQAMRINRASVFSRDGQTIKGYADDEFNKAEKSAGTSFATPQVAAAAALWVEKNYDSFHVKRPDEKWKFVEEFRSALRASSDQIEVRDDSDPIKGLNIEKLLKTKPVPFEGAPAGEATDIQYYNRPAKPIS